MSAPKRRVWPWILGGAASLVGLAVVASHAYSAGAAPEPPLTDGEKALLTAAGVSWAAPNGPPPADAAGKVLLDRGVMMAASSPNAPSPSPDARREIHDVALSLGGVLSGSLRAGKLVTQGWRFWQRPSAGKPLTVKIGGGK